MCYEPRLLDSAVKALKRLDKTVVRRIMNRIRWVSENFISLEHLPLTGNLAGFYKIRIGNYRVIYEILEDERIIMIHMIGHRKDIYKKV